MLVAAAGAALLGEWAEGAFLLFLLLIGWMALEESFYRAMLLLVAASPCALAIGTPAAVLAGIAHGARNGVLIKGGVHLENLGTRNVVACDKTGALTEGRFKMTDIIAVNGASRTSYWALRRQPSSSPAIPWPWPSCRPPRSSNSSCP